MMWLGKCLDVARDRQLTPKTFLVGLTLPFAVYTILTSLIAVISSPIFLLCVLRCKPTTCSDVIRPVIRLIPTVDSGRNRPPITSKMHRRRPNIGEERRCCGTAG